MSAKTMQNSHVEPPGQPSPAEDPLRLVPKVLTRLYSLWVSLTYPFASLGRSLSVHPSCDWRRSRAHRIKLGNSVQIRKDAILHIAVPPEESGEPIIVIEDESCLGPQCQMSAKNRVHIERDVLVGQSVLIMDHGYDNEDCSAQIRDQSAEEGGRIRIGQGSWIGYRAAIVCTQGELTLGRNCVVAANAVVTRSFPPYSVIFGNPARVIKQFDPVKDKWVLKST
jgi:acetyltransferase-like isoleucine patch superfamily enzyme